MTRYFACNLILQIQIKLVPLSTAILIFARSAHLDASQKGLAGSERFLSELTAQAILKARRTGYPCFHSDESSQVGDTFGERLGNAMKALYDKGVDHLIVIGNDSPDLQTKTLLEAAGQLSQGRTVLGPSADGGTYLIGLSRLHFDLGAFVRLPWQKNTLFKAFFDWDVSRGGCPSVLESKLDLDNLRDCVNWDSDSQFTLSRLLRLLRSFACSNALWGRVEDLPISRVPLAIPFNKGSPS